MWKTTWSREKRNAIKQSRGSRPEEKQIFRVTRLHRSFDNRKQGRSEKFLKLSYEFDSKLSSQFPRSIHTRAIRCDSYRFFIFHFSCHITWLLFLDNTRYKKNLENYNYFITLSASNLLIGTMLFYGFATDLACPRTESLGIKGSMDR